MIMATVAKHYRNSLFETDVNIKYLVFFADAYYYILFRFGPVHLPNTPRSFTNSANE